MGPRIKLSLPSFSGGTLECPHLLQYSCDLQTNVMILPPAVIQGSDSKEKQGSGSLEDLSSVLGGRTIVTLSFDQMEMTVEEPKALVLEKGSGSKHTTQLV
jgi:hypothetical protein